MIIKAEQVYWDERILDAIRGSGIANPHDNLQDEFLFVDGDRHQDVYETLSWMQGVRKITSTENSWGYMRRIAGNKSADADFSRILESLAKDPESGKIVEKIQVYTHSRGAAFSEGYVSHLLELIGDNAHLFEDPSDVIEFMFHMAPHQSGGITTVDGIPSYSIDHTWDMASGNDIRGNNIAFKTNTARGSPGFAHKNRSFVKELGAFFEAYSDNPGDNKKLIDDFVRKMNDLGVKVKVSEK